MSNSTKDLTKKRLLRVKQIIGDPISKPPVPAILPISKSTFWSRVQKGIIPKPMYPLGPRMPLWSYEDIEKLIQR